jgi:hypothetical protein
VTALVLSGPAESVVAHIPEACYPANGYWQLGSALDKNIEFDKKNARQAWFRSIVYAKGGSLGMPPFAEEVYYSFQFKGNWNPFPSSATRITRRSPWVIKIQAQRRVGATEDREIDNPTQEFLAKLVPEVEALLKESGVKTSVDQAASAARPATALAAGS